MMKRILNEWRRFLLNENAQRADYVKDDKIKLYHFSSKSALEDKDSFIMDPQYFVDHRGSYSKNEWETSNVARSFFYTDLSSGTTEPRISSQPHLFSVEVDADKIYDFKKDPEDYWGKYRHPTYGMRKWVDWNPMLEDIRTKYDGIFYTIGDGSIPIVAYFKEIEVKRIPKP